MKKRKISFSRWAKEHGACKPAIRWLRGKSLVQAYRAIGLCQNGWAVWMFSALLALKRNDLTMRLAHEEWRIYHTKMTNYGRELRRAISLKDLRDAGLKDVR